MHQRSGRHGCGACPGVRAKFFFWGRPSRHLFLKLLTFVAGAIGNTDPSHKPNPNRKGQALDPHAATSAAETGFAKHGRRRAYTEFLMLCKLACASLLPQS